MMDHHAGSPRAQNRARNTERIMELARTQIAESGPADLSLRAIARQMGMASSAIYRYFASRDELLTALIIASYESLADDVQAAARLADSRGLDSRFSAYCSAMRHWSLAHPHEFFLIYGTPVPGYQAPQDTISSAERVAAPFMELLVAIDSAKPTRPWPPLSRPTRRAIGPMSANLPPNFPPALIARGLAAFSALIGAILIELNGQFHNVVASSERDRDAWFRFQVSDWFTQFQPS